MENLKEPIHKIVKQLGYELYDLIYENRDEDGRVLSVEIDHPKGIDIDDCVKVSEAVSLFLDEVDPISEAYSLEVISAGAERLLRNDEEMHQAIGKYVLVKTLEQTIEGTLLEVNETSIKLLDSKKKNTFTILKADIELIRLAISF
ncbi:MAG: ribosome maturation factor RimP [Candidatus Izemoplasmataceae bacterium]